LPAAWRTQLHQAASQADDELISTLLEQVRTEHGPLVKVLAGLARDFRFDQIIECLEADS